MVQHEVFAVPHSLPSSESFLRAVDIYLMHAYQNEPPSAVRFRVETLRAMPAEEFYQSAVLERNATQKPTKFFLRLGNQTYPHMKMALYRLEDSGWAFAVEEHDQVGFPRPGSREYRFFAQMVAHNHELALEIEAAWQASGLTIQPRLNDCPISRELLTHGRKFAREHLTTEPSRAS
jgi:hypothetical protein